VLRAADNSGRKSEAAMEIGPIPGIRAVPAVRTPQGGIQPPAVFDIDASAKPGDADERRSGRKAAGAEENEQEDRLLADEMGDSAEAPDEQPGGQVDTFA